MDAILDELESWRREHDLALLVFTTPDCGVCNALKPKVAEIAESYPRLAVRYLDLTEHPAAGGQYGVFVVPVFLLYVQGRETLRLARHFGMHELEEPVARYAALLESE
ncbi:MAG: thioredoxin family protein [Spirochaetota bacterium]